MKNYLIALIFISITFISCKKDRDCTCTVYTTGVKTIHNQTAGTSFSFPPLPPIVLIAAKDTTSSEPYAYYTNKKENYHKVSKNSMKKNCPATEEENTYDSYTINSPGTSTVTVTDSGKRTYTCKIE